MSFYKNKTYYILCFQNRTNKTETWWARDLIWQTNSKTRLKHNAVARIGAVWLKWEENNGERLSFVSVFVCGFIRYSCELGDCSNCACVTTLHATQRMCSSRDAYHYCICFNNVSCPLFTNQHSKKIVTRSEVQSQFVKFSEICPAPINQNEQLPCCIWSLIR